MTRRAMTDQILDSEDIRRWAEEKGFDLSPAEAGSICGYVELLVKYNRKMNLVGKQGYAEILDDLIVDSLHLARFLEREFKTPDPVCLDFGAGAGLPGIPLRALWTKGSYLLVEPRAKRAVFMETVLGKCRIKNTEVFEGRVEDLPAGTLPADLILGRAFLPPEKFMDLARPLLAPGGMLVVMALEPTAQEPHGYEPQAEYSYETAGKKRYFWGLAPASISS